MKCPSCPRKFDNHRALNGHQNAHRKERLAKLDECIFVVLVRKPTSMGKPRDAKPWEGFS